MRFGAGSWTSTPVMDRGLRVEMDDDVVERIQSFDPSTQRSLGDGLDRVEMTALDPFPGDLEWRDALPTNSKANIPPLLG